MACRFFAMAALVALAAPQGSSNLPEGFPFQFTAVRSHMSAFPIQPTAESQRTRTTVADGNGRFQSIANSTADVHTFMSSRPPGTAQQNNQAFDLDVTWMSGSKVFVQMPTPGGRKRHPHTRRYNHTTKFKPLTLTVPGREKIFIAFNYSWGCLAREHKIYAYNQSHLRHRLLYGRKDTTVVVAKYVTLALPASETIPYLYCGFGLTLSFHKVSNSMLHQLPDRTWNCSVPHWPDFEIHFRCNLKMDCVGGEDEMDCPYTGHCGLGRVTVNNRCYELVHYQPQSWTKTNNYCKDRGGYLASFNTKSEFDTLIDVLSYMDRARVWTVGIRYAADHWPN